MLVMFGCEDDKESSNDSDMLVDNDILIEDVDIVIDEDSDLLSEDTDLLFDEDTNLLAMAGILV